MNTQRAPRDCIDGLLLLDKPTGMTSNDALMRARRLFNARKAGHGGTLDPMASGLLPIAFGEATKFAADALGADKTYLAELTFGVTTETGDAEGAVLERRAVDVSPGRLREAVSAFVGEIEQIPPMYSALKRDGKPLYKYARAGETVERSPRRVTIHSIEIIALGAVDDVAPGQAGSMRAVLRVACSKGTYVRTLAEDIGKALGCGAHLSALRRERVGPTGLERAVTIEQLEAMTPQARAALLAPLDFLLDDLPTVALDDAHARRFLQGQRLRLSPPVAPAADSAPDHDSRPARRVRVYRNAEMLGVASLEDGLLVPIRLVGVARNSAANAAR